eukprot:TRINITY_DN1356_c0_g1_i1.p1 TRINITY_DN1356_c0_g1~~TRINITY_DN1356_c0_g1_i1.p1  ORF type:complete len:728 (-),score=209.06 TRINITY_DN1356_c0_g1_i1:108-2291(-)
MKEEEKKKKKEKEDRRKEEEKRAEEDEVAETKELESVKLGPGETSTTYSELYHLFPSEVFVAYDKLQDFARDLNTQISHPEIVLIGLQGHGKSSILEALLGHQINTVGYGGATQRPLYLNIINNTQCETPKVTIKRDSVLSEFDHDEIVPLTELSNEIEKRNKIVSSDAVFVQYEFKDTCNMTFIDTPGLIPEDQGDLIKTKIDQTVMNLAKPPHRLILCVEEAKDWERIEMMDFVKQLDPELSRTTFVYTKFHNQLQKMTNTRQVNRFLSGTPPDTKSFFTTLISTKLRQKFSESDRFQEKIWQAYRRDMNGLEQLQFDKRFEANIGLHALRKYLLHLSWKNYQDNVPKILKRLRQKKASSENALEKIQSQLATLDSLKLRSLASDYVVDFLQIIERLITGTSEGNPTVNGQSLEEEKLQHGDGEWIDAHNRIIKFDPDEWKIPYWDSKLYGGQQFERLLSEFKSVAEHTRISDVTMDDVATAAGINKLNNIPNYAWAACDLAQQKSREAFIPLIEQLCSRTVYTMKRLTDIAEKIVESRKVKWNLRSDNVFDTDNLEQYPYFTFHVKDLYYKFVELTAQSCLEKCLDEFYDTRTIYWDLTEYADRSLPMDRNDPDTKRAVVDLATELFKETLQKRIIKNVLLKFYNFFLVPMQTELWSVVQGKISSLSDTELEQIFEVNATKDRIKEEEKRLLQIVSQCAEQEVVLLEAASKYSHPVLVGLSKVE